MTSRYAKGRQNLGIFFPSTEYTDYTLLPSVLKSLKQ